MMEKLLELLKTERVLVTFTKADGSQRDMICTQRQDLINSLTFSRSQGPEGIICVWDLEKEAWRSFKKERVITYGKAT
jgi:hypothetical protein